MADIVPALSLKGKRAGGSGTIPALQNSVTVTHNLDAVPTWAIAVAVDNVAAAAGVHAVDGSYTATTIDVAYPLAVSQDFDGKFNFEVGV